MLGACWISVCLLRVVKTNKRYVLFVTMARFVIDFFIDASKVLAIICLEFILLFWEEPLVNILKSVICFGGNCERAYRSQIILKVSFFLMFRLLLWCQGEAFVPENVVRFGRREAGRKVVQTLEVYDDRIK